MDMADFRRINDSSCTFVVGEEWVKGVNLISEPREADVSIYSTLKSRYDLLRKTPGIYLG